MSMILTASGSDTSSQRGRRGNAKSHYRRRSRSSTSVYLQRAWKGLLIISGISNPGSITCWIQNSKCRGLMNSASAAELIAVKEPPSLTGLAPKPPALFLPDEKARDRFFDFFTANIRNKNTRRAYYK